MLKCALLISMLISSACFAADANNLVTFTGKAVDANDRPVANAQATFYKFELALSDQELKRTSTETAVTDSNGTFSFKSQSRTPEGIRFTIGSIIVRKPGLAIAWEEWSMRTGKQSDLKMGLPVVCKGIIVDEADKPLSDANVTLMLSRGSRFSYPTLSEDVNLFKTRSGTDGMFSFNSVPADAMMDFIVSKPDYATICTFKQDGNRRNLTYSPDQNDIKIILPPAAKIIGTVIDKEAGKGVGGLTIALMSQGMGMPFLGSKKVISDPNGCFSIDALPAGAFVLNLRSNPEKISQWTAQPVPVTVEQGKTVTDIRIELTKGGILEVIITDQETRKPIDKARVHVSDKNGGKGFEATSDSNGIARIRLPADEYMVGSIYKDGYSRSREMETATVENNNVTKLEMQLSPQPKIKGVVRDKSGNPATGINVNICPDWYGPSQAVTGQKGEFELGWNPEWLSQQGGNFYLIAVDEKRNLAAAADLNEDTKTLDIVLEPAISITGLIVDPNGSGISAPAVRIMIAENNMWFDFRREVTVDSNGRFTAGTLPQGLSYKVNAGADGYGQKTLDAPTADETEAKLDIGKIELPIARMSVSGTVVDANDKPVPSVMVQSYGNEQPNKHAVTDAQGKFVLDKLCPGIVSLNAWANDSSGRGGFMSVESGSTDVKIMLQLQVRRMSAPPMPKLFGKALPDMNELNIELSAADANNKSLLLCVCDFQQRPSRHMMTELVKQIPRLEEKELIIAAVQFGRFDEKQIDQWKQKNNLTFPMSIVSGDIEKKQSKWGIQGLPWLILTDAKHTVIAEGFALDELEGKLASQSK